MMWSQCSRFKHGWPSPSLLKRNGQLETERLSQTELLHALPRIPASSLQQDAKRLHLGQGDRETEGGAAAKILGRGYTVLDNFGSGSRTVIRQKWSCAQLHFDAKASGIVKKILQACGLDWQTTTALELDHLVPRLVCLKCSGGNKCNGDRIMYVRGWRNAVGRSHTLLHANY